MADVSPESVSPNAPGDLTEVLPTRRVAFGKQLDILRAYAAAGATGAPVGNQEVADIVGLKPDTASLTNSFFLASGLIRRAEKGRMTPAPEVVAFQRAYQWSPETAAHELAPILEDAWFWQSLAPHLAMGPVTESKAMAILGQASNATKHRAAELNLIVDYLEVAGVVDRQDNHVRLPGKKAAARTPTVSPTPSQAPPTPSAALPAAEPTALRELPLLIRGLLEQLPSDGTWTRTGADNWLAMTKLALDVVYSIEPAPPENSDASGGGDTGR